jgi:spore germination protein GerM
MSEREDGVFGGALPPQPDPPAHHPAPAPPRRGGGRGWWWVLLVLLVVGGAVVVKLRQGGKPAAQELPAPEVGDETGTRSVTVYFGSYDGEGVVGEPRTIASRTHREEEVEAVVNEILRGPQSKQAVQLFPEGTRLRRAFYDEENRLLYLDFTSALVGGQSGGSAMEILTLTTLLRTIAVDFPEVVAVQLLVDGQEVETLAGHIDLTRPLRAKDWL